MLDTITGAVNKLVSRLGDALLPLKPPAYLLVDGESFTKRLLFDGSFKDEDRDVFLLSDGALGTWWHLTPIPHEIKSEDELQEIVRDFAKVFKKITSHTITFQVIFEQTISDEFEEPGWPLDTYARRITKKRIEAIKMLASIPGDKPPLYKRKVFLTLRVETQFPDREGVRASLAETIEKQTEALEAGLRVLRDVARTLETSIQGSLSEPLVRASEADLLAFMQDTLHSRKPPGQQAAVDSTINSPGRLADRCLSGSIEWDKDAIGVSEDTWESLSWSSQPPQIFPGIMTRLMQIKLPIRCVVNIRPRNFTGDLEALSNKLQGGDPYQERQKRDVHETEDRVVGGEKLLDCSVHVFVRNRGVSIAANPALRSGEAVARDLSEAFPCFRERFAAFPVFMVCLPFHYSGKVTGFISREKRVLSDDIGHILPVFGGTRGALAPKQLMQARSGEAIWLNQRTGKTNPHFAVFGGSQSGKSFWFANFLTSEFAYDPNTLVFLIDSITSVEYLGRAIGEDHGFRFIKPPAEYPNLFRGELTPERLPVIMSILDVAVRLIARTELSSSEQTLLAQAILKAFDDNRAASKSRYIRPESRGDLGSYESTDASIRVVKMSDIVNKLNTVAEQLEISENLTTSLREKLLPFFGAGAFASLFDQEEFEKENEPSAGLTIFDLAELSKGPLRTIVTLILIADIERQFNLPQNAGRRGCLIIEEAGVNLSGASEALENYIKDAFARFAKRQITCGAITNQIAHYLDLPACKAAWNTSATNIILPVVQEGERKRLAELTHDSYVAELAKSLDKRPGSYSEFLWLGDDVRGSVTYVPTGYDYWLAANHRGDTEPLEHAYRKFGSWQRAVDCLADLAPLGFRDATGSFRPPTAEELHAIENWRQHDH